MSDILVKFSTSRVFALKRVLQMVAKKAYLKPHTLLTSVLIFRHNLHVTTSVYPMNKLHGLPSTLPSPTRTFLSHQAGRSISHTKTGVFTFTTMACPVLNILLRIHFLLLSLNYQSPFIFHVPLTCCVEVSPTTPTHDDLSARTLSGIYRLHDEHWDNPIQPYFFN